MKVLALSGGVGGARLVDGLAAVVPADELTVVVNTGDDFVHWGLTICPDLDTVMYTLAGLAHPTQGWGVAGETFGALAMVERYGGPAWFRLGDRDLGTHLMRAAGLAAGRTLTAVTAELAPSLGLAKPGGVVVQSVWSKGPAARAGLTAGDVILAVAGLRQVRNPSRARSASPEART